MALTMGRSNKVRMLLGVIQVVLDAHVLEIDNVDLIMGVVWLETIGKVTIDRKEIPMVFKHGEKVVKLVDKTLEDRTTSF